VLEVEDALQDRQQQEEEKGVQTVGGKGCEYDMCEYRVCKYGVKAKGVSAVYSRGSRMAQGTLHSLLYTYLHAAACWCTLGVQGCDHIHLERLTSLGVWGSHTTDTHSTQRSRTAQSASGTGTVSIRRAPLNHTRRL
jgi:hypothetical protein